MLTRAHLGHIGYAPKGLSKASRACENFLYGFKADPPGRSRRSLGAQVFALAGAPLRPGQRRSAGAKNVRAGPPDAQRVSSVPV
jgi:hypothetical protein